MLARHRNHSVSDVILLLLWGTDAGDLPLAAVPVYRCSHMSLDVSRIAGLVSSAICELLGRSCAGCADTYQFGKSLKRIIIRAPRSASESCKFTDAVVRLCCNTKSAVEDCLLLNVFFVFVAVPSLVLSDVGEWSSARGARWRL